MKFFKSLALVFFMSMLGIAHAQIVTPVKWSFSSKMISEKEALITFKAKIDKGWHLYSQNTPDGGPVATNFTIKSSPDYTPIGKVKEISKAEKMFEKAFEVDVIFFAHEAVFQQKIKVNTDKAFVFQGDLEFMVCDDTRCLAPEVVEYEIKVEPSTFKSTGTSSESNKDNPAVELRSINTELSEKKELPTADTNSKIQESQKSANPIDTNVPTKTKDTLWTIFIGGFLGGFLALLTPCVFPMIPLTVSFFTKRAGNRAKSISQALIYGISIIVIYVALGFIVTKIFGADALNDMASNVYFNLIFFVLLVVFAISFLGAFEITLPSSFINKMDSKADKGGLLGIFFMAFTLSLVSFSCTGPIIGTLLVQAAVSGSNVGPLVGMGGFSLALALPFALFAIFPSWLTSLPKSGGWLNSVKVVLGFLELALALKFLSNVDLAYHWGILDREVFLVLWIVIFAMLGFYLLGKLKFSHDSDLNYVSIPRLFFAIISLSFSVYMIPGLWGAPLKAISAFAPPMGTQDFIQNGNGGAGAGEHRPTTQKKYGELFHCPHNLDCYFDFDEAMAAAKKANKPLFVDFTGHSCVNCRKMEASVWADPGVLEKLNQDYIVVSLYVDDKTELAEAEKYTSSFSGKNIKTVGNKWSDLQASKYGTNSQPYYVLLDHDGNLMTEPRGFDQDIPAYIDFLKRGMDKFAAVK